MLPLVGTGMMSDVISYTAGPQDRNGVKKSQRAFRALEERPVLGTVGARQSSD